MRNQPSLIVLSDIHLGRDAPKSTVRDLCTLFESYPGHEFVLAGDVFDLSLEPRGAQAGDVVAGLLEQHSSLRAAVRRHLGAGGQLALLPGNHDSELAQVNLRQRLLSRLDLQEAAQLSLPKWFIRRGSVHIEHGHLYDPDNAPLHPLVEWTFETEPLGVALMRRFVAASGATHFAHANETTPLRGFLSTWYLYGWRAPRVIANYFATAGGLCVRAARTGPASRSDRGRGRQLLGEFASENSLPCDVLEQLIAVAPDPTHASWRETFMRLYFDRVISCVVGVGAGGLGALGVPGALPVAALAGSYLIASVLAGGSRYSDRAVEGLRLGARHILANTDAKLVLFGHTHELDESPGYLNLGSFAFTHGGRRPYVAVTPSGLAERRFLHSA